MARPLHRIRPKSRAFKSSTEGPQPLPSGQFGLLIGRFIRTEPASRYRNHPGDNHIYLWLGTHSASDRHSYECAVTLASTMGPGQLGSMLQSSRDELLLRGDLPSFGFHGVVSCSYAALGLSDTDFIPVLPEVLVASLIELARDSAMIGAYGVTYHNGEGLHDIHLNSHEGPESFHRDRLDRNENPTHDGALVFFIPDPSGSMRAHWLFLKFPTQSLPSTQSSLRLL
jgi:Uncharacterized conserved protein (DUF2278)